MIKNFAFIDSRVADDLTPIGGLGAGSAAEILALASVKGGRMLVRPVVSFSSAVLCEAAGLANCALRLSVPGVPTVAPQDHTPSGNSDAYYIPSNHASFLPHRYKPGNAPAVPHRVTAMSTAARAHPATPHLFFAQRSLS